MLYDKFKSRLRTKGCFFATIAQHEVGHAFHPLCAVRRHGFHDAMKGCLHRSRFGYTINTYVLCTFNNIISIICLRSGSVNRSLCICFEILGGFTVVVLRVSFTSDAPHHRGRSYVTENMIRQPMACRRNNLRICVVKERCRQLIKSRTCGFMKAFRDASDCRPNSEGAITQKRNF